MRYGIIYKAKLINDGRVYIGQTTKTLEERKKGHISHSKHSQETYFVRAINKYGEQNFTWTILEECYSKEELDLAEQKYILQYSSLDPIHGFNTKEGGSRGKHTEETKKIISEGKLGEKNGMYNKPSWNKGKKLTKEHTEKIKTKFSKGQVPWNKGKKGEYSTKPCTEENKQIISKKNRGENNGQAKITLEIANKIRSLYESGILQKDLAIAYSISRANVSNIINNKLWRNNEK